MCGGFKQKIVGFEWVIIKYKKYFNSIMYLACCQ